VKVVALVGAAAGGRKLLVAATAAAGTGMMHPGGSRGGIEAGDTTGLTARRGAAPAGVAAAEGAAEPAIAAGGAADVAA
jgi:hypothetical protein